MANGPIGFPVMLILRARARACINQDFHSGLDEVVYIEAPMPVS
jgi:hypothetical protein